MEREEAVQRLRKLVGQDLRPLAEKYGVTVWKGGKLNKGWAGQVIERHLGLPINSSRAPNFGSWELKLISLKRLKDGTIRPKETMQITMIDPVHVKANLFETSHLLTKLRKAVICARLFESKKEERTLLYSVNTFDLDNPETYETVKQDYELVRQTLLDPKKGFSALHGEMGRYVQPRTKGPGHGSTSRAFYARTGFLARILGVV